MVKRKRVTIYARIEGIAVLQSSVGQRVIYIPEKDPVKKEKIIKAIMKDGPRVLLKGLAERGVISSMRPSDSTYKYPSIFVSFNGAGPGSGQLCPHENLIWDPW